MTQLSLSEQVRLSLGDDADEFDVVSITRHIRVCYGSSTHMDSLPREAFLAIARQHDRKKEQ